MFVNQSTRRHIKINSPVYKQRHSDVTASPPLPIVGLIWEAQGCETCTTAERLCVFVKAPVWVLHTQRKSSQASQQHLKLPTSQQGPVSWSRFCTWPRLRFQRNSWFYRSNRNRLALVNRPHQSLGVFCGALTLVFTVQLLPLVVQILFSQMLNIQEPLHDLIHRPIYERLSQVTQRVVGQALLEGAKHTGEEQQWPVRCSQ